MCDFSKIGPSTKKKDLFKVKCLDFSVIFFHSTFFKTFFDHLLCNMAHAQALISVQMVKSLKDFYNKFNFD